MPLSGDQNWIPSPAERASAFDQVISDGLPAAAAALTALYAFYAWDHLRDLPPHASGIMCGVASVTAAIGLVIYLFVRSRRFDFAQAHPFAAALAACVLVNSLAHMYLLSEPDRTINLALLIIAVGCFFLSTRWLTLAIVATCAGWLLVAWLSDPGGGVLRGDYTLFKATVLAVVIQLGRVRAYSRLEGLRLAEVATKRALERVLASAQAARGSADSARRRAEEATEAVRHAHDELESKVAQRTAELAHTNAALRAEIAEGIRSGAVRQELELQLRQSQKMEAVGKLAGGVAHDFNNMLAVINGYSEIALMSLSAGNPLKGQLEEIRRAGERAAALTRQLLAFSRRQMLQPKVLALDEVVNGMHQMFRRLIGEDIELVNTHILDSGR